MKRQQSSEDDVLLPIVAPNLESSNFEFKHEIKPASAS